MVHGLMACRQRSCILEAIPHSIDPRDEHDQGPDHHVCVRPSLGLFFFLLKQMSRWGNFAQSTDGSFLLVNVHCSIDLIFGPDERIYTGPNWGTNLVFKG